METVQNLNDDFVQSIRKIDLQRLNENGRKEHESHMYWSLEVPESQSAYAAIYMFAHIMWNLHLYVS